MSQKTAIPLVIQTMFNTDDGREIGFDIKPNLNESLIAPEYREVWKMMSVVCTDKIHQAINETINMNYDQLLEHINDCVIRRNKQEAEAKTDTEEV